MYSRFLQIFLGIFLTFIFVGAVQADHIEEEYTGIFCQTIENDFKNDKANIVYGFYKDRESLNKGRKPSKKLLFPKGMPEILKQGVSCGTEIRFKGRDTHSEKRVRVRADTFVYAGADSGGSGGTLAAPSGDQRTLVIITDFEDSTVGCASSTIESSVFTATNSMNAVFQDASYGALFFSGVVLRYTISRAIATTTSCDYTGWASAAESLAQANGVNLSLYPRRLFFLPGNVPCSWGGVANLGGNPSRAWVKGCSTGIAIHEEGHNLTMHHASSLINGTLSEYGDGSDPMGGAAIKGFNAPHKDQMDWISPTQISSSTTVTLDAVNIDPVTAQNPQIIKFAKPDTNDWYYISYRDGTDFDTNLSTSYKNRVSIHTYKGGMVQSILLGTLGDGQSYTDSVNNYVVSMISHTASTATVQIQLTGGPAAPSLSVTPLTQVGAPGISKSYTVQLTNRDVGDTISTFNLSAVAPSGWIGNFSSDTLTLAPGASGSATLIVTPPTDALNGYFTLTVNVTDSAQPIHSANTQITYQVVAPDTIAPAVVVTAPSNGSTVPTGGGGTVTIGCRATDGVAVTTGRIYINNVLKNTKSFNNTPLSVNWSKGFKSNSFVAGTNSIRCEATDSSGNIGSSSISIIK